MHADVLHLLHEFICFLSQSAPQVIAVWKITRANMFLYYHAAVAVAAVAAAAIVFV